QAVRYANGYTYDIETGQVSSPYTGRVYETKGKAPFYGFGFKYPYHYYPGYYHGYPHVFY
uniref:Cuticle protein 7 isoform b n=1 Tax=Limulus polyphemus TaxID=6850 RepID=CU7B_LIMPO|nr:RecName: Full=Cuticle protein 7 isoform b; AltName: Full=LpCP7b [Limulus polyphemus]